MEGKEELVVEETEEDEKERKR